MKINSLSIFIFSYNEAENIQKVIKSASVFLDENVADGELLVVNDGSTDNTSTILNELKAIYTFQLINHNTNQGIGKALKSGYNNATKDFVVGVPGDGQFDVNELLLIEGWEPTSFYSFYRKKKNYSWYRSFLTGFNKQLINKLLNNNLKDVNWVKVYSKKQLKLAAAQLDSSLIESEISSKLIKRGYLCKEISSNYYPRTSGNPKGGNLFTVSKALFEMLKLIRIVRKF